MRWAVVDASVAVKWFVEDGEADVAKARALFGDLRGGRIRLVQPPHWIAEVAAVLARLSPETAVDDVADLCAMSCRTASSAAIHGQATTLAVDLDHHLFDTLYHAVALGTPGAVLVTADDRYARKAAHLGSLVRLEDLTPAPDEP